MAIADGDKTSRQPFKWVAWWLVDDKVLAKQIAGYKTLPLHETSRGQGLILMLLSAAISIALIVASTHAYAGLVDVAILVGLGVFIYLGHRWAMIAAMILWSLEKALQLYGIVHTGVSFQVITVFLWWTAYMHVFYVAFRIEQRRRAQPEIQVSTFD